MRGYHIGIHFNDSYAFYGRTDVRRCEACGELIDKESESLAGLKIRKRKKWALSATYDGVDVASIDFKRFYEANDLIGLLFTQLPSAQEFYRITSNIIIPYDSEKGITRFFKNCLICGQYQGIFITGPIYLKEGAVIPDNGFARTDIEFAHHDEKSPLLLCGISAGKLILDSGLKGIDLEEITDAPLKTPRKKYMT